MDFDQQHRITATSSSQDLRQNRNISLDSLISEGFIVAGQSLGDHFLCMTKRVEYEGQLYDVGLTLEKSNIPLKGCERDYKIMFAPSVGPALQPDGDAKPYKKIV